jgi:site-specific recombinase XerD
LNPGSHTPQACILNQARRRPHSDTCLTTENKKPISNKTEEAIINTLIAMKNNAKAEITIKQVSYKLKQISEHADLTKPEEVKQYIANSKKQNGEPTAEPTKNKLIFAYDNFAEINKIQWEKPYYNYEPKIPLIPTKENVNKIISASSKKYATIFTILTETGLEGHELEKTSRKSIDTEQGIINAQGCKGHASGTYKLKQQTAEMLRIYIHKYTNDYPFPPSKIMGETWRKTRNKLAEKLSQPDLKKIPLKNLRNYSGAQLYYKTQDPIAVMRHLRHKKLETTMHYIRGITTGGEEEYTTKAIQTGTTTTLKEIIEIANEGYQKFTEIDGYQLFRKRK